MVGVRFQEETVRELRGHLERAYPEESGAFLLLGVVPLGRRSFDLTVVDLILPGPEDWSTQGEHCLTPTTAYINRAVVLADRRNLGLGFVHSHPNPEHPAGLSWIDDLSTRRLFHNIGGILPGAPLASLVFTPSGFSGVSMFEGCSHRIEQVRTIGNRVLLERAADQEGPASDGEVGTAFERQILALGEEGQRILGRLRVAVVGAGGTGSAVSEQLVRMGVRHLVLLDDDVLVPSNVTRVYGATPTEAGRGELKVRILGKHLTSIAPDLEVVPLSVSVVSEKARAALLDVDLVFGCTDTDGSRAELNDLALKFYVPVIDMGCKIETRLGIIQGVHGRVRYLRPGLPCLWCTDTIDGRRVLQESLSPEERARLIASGYGTSLGPQPSVIHLTSLVASLAVHEFLTVFLGAGHLHDGTWVSVDLLEPRLTRVLSRVNPECRCQKITGIGAIGKP